MKKIIIVSLAFIGLCISCTSRRVELPSELVYDSLSIDVDYPFLSVYTSPRPFYRSDTLYMGAYNHMTHAYDFIDLSGEGKHFTIPLQREGKDGIGTSVDIFDMQKGILVKESTGFKWIDDEGRVIKNWNLFEVTDSLTGNLYSIHPRGALLGDRFYTVFDDTRREVIFPLFPAGDMAMEHRILGGKLNIENDKISFLPVSYPSMFDKETLNKGNFFVPQFTVSGDKLIYNFYGFSNFWTLSSSGAVEEYNMPSRYTKNQSPVPDASIDVWSLLKQELIALRFGEVHHMAPLHCYARVHYAPKENRKDPSISYLTLMDEDGTIWNEYPLPSSFTEKYFVAGTNMYFFIKSTEDDSKILLARIRLEDYI